MCLVVCGKPLGCGKHVCEDFCHLGRCPPCRIIMHEPLTCACGACSIPPPVRCGTAPPECNRLCGAALPCGHECVAPCHYDEHPLCCELVSWPCLGGHRAMHNQRCHVGPISCGQSCGRTLLCGHSCAAHCHAGICPPCTRPCGARRLYCGHRCQAPCHPEEECDDAPCRQEVKASCACGLQVEKRLCGAYSEVPRPEVVTLRCLASCERPSLAEQLRAAQQQQSRSATRGGSSGSGGDRYAADLYQLALRHRKYVQTLESCFLSVAAGSVGHGAPPAGGGLLPPCEGVRRLLATEYARLHWHFKTSSRADTADGWWRVRVEPAPTARLPRPTLLQLLQAGPAPPAALLPVLGPQPLLHFFGVKGAGDEVYELVGSEGLLGVRPGVREGELLAFLERGALAAAAFRRLTGEAPGMEPLPLRTGGAAAAGLLLSLEQTLGAPAPAVGRPQPRPPDRDQRDEDVPPTAAASATAVGATTATATAAAPAPQQPRVVLVRPEPAEPAEPEEVLDSWEDALDS